MSETGNERLRALEQLRAELEAGGRSAELAALDQVIDAAKVAERAAPSGASPGDAVLRGMSSATGGAQLDVAGSGQAAAAKASSSASKQQARTYLKLKKKFYTPAEVARRVGVSRQTIVKWIERGELEAELTPGGHHRIPASVFHREGRGEAVQLIPADVEE